jgi:CheY-like chemotaxis protein
MKSRSAKILIVDDEPDMCWVVSQIIQSQGLEVVIAYTGEDACLKMANGDFSVVFLDAKLPDMDGLDVARHITSTIEEKPRVVLVSGYHYQDDPVVRNAQNEHIISCFLAKPFTNEELLAILIKLI